MEYVHQLTHPQQFRVYHGRGDIEITGIRVWGELGKPVSPGHDIIMMTS